VIIHYQLCKTYTIFYLKIFIIIQDVKNDRVEF